MPPLIGDEGDNIREFPQVTERYLSVAPQVNLFSARVNGPIAIANTNNNLLFGVWLDEVSTSIFALHYDGESGTAASCDTGFTVLIGTAAGKRDIGVMYLRAAINTSDKIIYVSETAHGEVPIHDNDYITIIYEQRPQQSVLRLQTTATGSYGIETDFIEYHNYNETYINQNNYIIPVANINRPSVDYPGTRKLNAFAAGWCRAEWDDNFRITLTSVYSYSMNGNAISVLWDIADCTLVGMGAALTDEEITIDCPSGFRYIKLTVTDDVTGVVSRPRYHPVFAHDDAFPTIDFGTRGFHVSGDTRADGRRMSFDIFGQDGDAGEAIFPRGALTVYWEEPYFNAEDVPELYISQFIGWISSKQFRPVKHAGTLTLEVFGIEGWMAEHLSGFGTRITDESHLPGKWYEMENITVGKMIHYLLREYSTVLYSANLYIPDLLRHDRAEDVNKDKLWNQINTIAKAFGCIAGADSGNAIWIRQDPFYNQDRGSIVSLGTILSDDITEEGLTITESEVKSIGVVNGTGSVWDGVSAEPEVFAARSPGVSPGTGDGSDQFFWRVDSQDHLNFLTGQLYAKVNSRFKSLQFTLIGNMDVFEPCWRDKIFLDYTEPNVADFEIGTENIFLIQSISVAHSDDEKSPSKRLTITLEELTLGEDGVFIEIPDDPLPSPVTIDPNDWNTQPSIPPFPNDVSTDPVADFTPDATDANPTPAPLPLGFAVTGLDKKLCRTYHFIDTDVLWVDATPPLERGILIDYKAIWNEGGQTMHCYAAYKSSETEIKIWKCDIFQQTLVWTLDETLTIEGTNPTAIGSIDFNDTTSTVGLAYLAEDGVYAAVKVAGTWGTFAAVGGGTGFSDDTVLDRDLQLLVDADDNIIVCGLTDDKTYQLFIAPGTNSFVAMDDTPDFNTPVNSIVTSGTDMYVSSWNADGEGGANGPGAGGNDSEEHTTSASSGDTPSTQEVYDFTTGDGGWDIVSGGGGPQAQYVPGSGYGSLPGPAQARITISKTFPSARTPKFIRIKRTLPVTNGDTNTQTIYDNVVGFLNASSSASVDVTYPLVATLTTISIDVVSDSLISGVAVPGYVYEIILTFDATPAFSVLASTDPTSSPPGQDSGFDVTDGLSYHITATGTWTGGFSLFDANGWIGHSQFDLVLPSGTTFQLIYRIGSAGAWKQGGTDFILVADATDRVYFAMNDAVGAFVDNSGSISVHFPVQDISNSLVDPTAETNNSGALFPGMISSATYPLVWDLNDDDPKQFDETKGFLSIRWNFLENQKKKLDALVWYLNIKYISDLNTTPDTTTKLKFRWKVTMKEKDQPPDMTTGELLFTKAASTLYGTVGDYFRLVQSPDMMVGLDVAGKQLEYLECRADLVPTATDLVNYSSGETLAAWEIFTSPYGETGSPAITYSNNNSGGSGSQMWHIAAYATAPVWTDINPGSGSNEDTLGRAAKKKYGLTVDLLTSTTLYMCGFDTVNSWICKSEDSGVTWSLVAKYDGNWLKVHDSTFLIGGLANLTLAVNGIDGNASSRKGDLNRFMSPPIPGHTEILITG